MERPILFSGEMVCAILEGRKTQTRRVIMQDVNGKVPFTDELPCPYGHAGDRLWVRETFKCEELEPYGNDGVRFRADGVFRDIENSQEASRKWMEAYREGGKWRPSIFMPRWASRITLEVVSLRLERVKKITRDDAKAEGVSSIWSYDGKKDPSYFERSVLNPYIANYSVLWDEINGGRGFGWDVNPFVWVVEFKVV